MYTLQIFLSFAFFLVSVLSAPQGKGDAFTSAQINNWYETNSLQPKGINFDYVAKECSQDQQKKLAIGILDAIELAKVAFKENERIRDGPHSDAFNQLFGYGWEDNDSTRRNRNTIIENFYRVYNFFINGPTLQSPTEGNTFAIHCKDIQERCSKGGVRAYTSSVPNFGQPAPYMVACPALFKIDPPQARDLISRRETPYLNYLTTYGSIILHEMMHAMIGLVDFPYYITDKTADLDNESDNDNACPPRKGASCPVQIYGPRRAMKYAANGRPNKGVRVNADTYALFATSVFFKERGGWSQYPLKSRYPESTNPGTRLRLRQDIGGGSVSYIGGNEDDGQSDPNAPDWGGKQDPTSNTPSDLDAGSTNYPNFADLVIRNKKLRIMPLGDSITVGWPRIPSNSYRKQLYTDLSVNGNTVEYVGSHQDGDFPDPRHEGQVGAKINTISSNADKTLSQRPNVVLVHAGTNDMGSDADANGAGDRLGSLIDKIIEKCPDAAILVARIIHNGDDASNARTKNYNNDVDDVVRKRAGDGKHVYLVDQYDSIDTGDIDTLHPYQTGYDTMGDVWNQALQQVNSFGWIKDPVAGTGGPTSKDTCKGELFWNPYGELLDGAGLGQDFFGGVACVDDPQKKGSVCICTQNHGNRPGNHVETPRSGKCSDLSVPDTHAVTFADLNGDGRAEYIWIGASGDAMASINGGLDDKGKFIWQKPVPIAGGINGASRNEIRFADLNGDGRAEYIRVHPDGALDIWLNVRNDSETGSSLGINWLPQANSASGFGNEGPGVQFADLNGDGRAEYLYIDAGGAVTVYLNEGGKDNGPNAGVITWSLQEQSAKGVGWTRANTVFADMNGDGRADYLEVSRTDGSVKMWINGGGKDTGPNAGVITWLEVGKPIAAGIVGVNGTGLVFADVNGDGREEYLNVDPGSSKVDMWLNGCKE
ncbi:MAG: hypothetical protein M1835_003593 [Candelina submexicana]|nr:MAG: hypothetical protein M1835_003593 [Candelina submexicana]